MNTERPRSGLLVSVEGISGAGKTYLVKRLLDADPSLAAQTVVIEEFSRRPAGGDVGHDLLRALKHAAHGDPLLRGGRPAAETLMLLAIKAHDYEERCVPALSEGKIVIEGRSLHCVAAYQSLILHPDDEHAFTESLSILEIAAQWRPLPDLTVLVSDDPTEAIRRAEARDRQAFSPGYRRIHHRAATLFDRMATQSPGNIVVIDRRRIGSEAGAISALREHIAGCQAKPMIVTA